MRSKLAATSPTPNGASSGEVSRRILPLEVSPVSTSA
jgi:hypothetical protein